MAYKWTLLILLFQLPALAQAQDSQAQDHQARDHQARAREFHEKSQVVGISPAQRQGWLRQSLDAHPTFTAHYDLGNLLRESEDHEQALAQFMAAFRLTNEDRYLAQAAFQVGVAWYEMNRFVESRQWLRRSLSYQDHPKVRKILKEVELSRQDVLSSEEILRELRVTRGFTVAQAELRVHFEVNAARLNPKGQKQARELGLALEHPDAPGGTLVILGHTDRQCPRSKPDDFGCDQFNRGLSGQRADAVRNFLTSQFGVAGNRLRTLACGRQHPLTWDSSGNDHYLNRRVVVMVLSGDEINADELCRQGTGIF